MAKFIPVSSVAQQKPLEVWARMPDSTAPSGESDVELLATVTGAYSTSSSKIYSCMAPESRDVWSTSADEIVHGVRSIRMPLSSGALFTYRQTVGISPAVEWWQNRDGSRNTKVGTILAGWCETDSTAPHSRRYTYWVRCERNGAHITHRWYEQHELFAWPDKSPLLAMLPRQRRSLA